MKDDDITKGDGVAVLEVPVGPGYFIVVRPTAAEPEDRYLTTSTKLKLGAEVSGPVATTVRLSVNRWNRKNVDDTWTERNIDPAKAAKVVTQELCGKKVQVNELCVERVEKTQKAFKALDEKLQKVFSNHSLGCAIDVNYNLATKQNAHLFKDNTADHELLDLAQAVVRSDPAHKEFDIWKDTGQAQLTASRVFNERFPSYARQWVAQATAPVGTAAQGEGQAAPQGGPEPPQAESVAKEGQASPETEVVVEVTLASVAAAEKAAKDADVKHRLRLIRVHWNTIRAWLDGSRTEGGTLVGMIPFHEAFLSLMLDNGWNWGGDWGSSKDYMHFEDREAMAKLKKDAPKAKEGEEGKKPQVEAEGHDDP